MKENLSIERMIELEKDSTVITDINQLLDKTKYSYIESVYILRALLMPKQ